MRALGTCGEANEIDLAATDTMLNGHLAMNECKV